ncbi:hypothetical protein FB45DRAFT_1052563 [Roridomyces roridus]|uniref:Uncharacterized protein n=1 Tax=Roridomyces roridus TaxID=1738132 RepID=A0AAD7CAE1_9AGAR|nr:hypothetical protein FB45DRAFT_1052563 [Roridomyces roridus]
MSTTRSASPASASTTDLESADLLPHPGSSGVTSIAQELIHSGNAAYKELLHSNIQSQEEYTNLVRDLRASLPDDADAPPWQFDPQQPALRKAHLNHYQLLRISPELQWSV